MSELASEQKTPRAANAGSSRGELLAVSEPVAAARSETDHDRRAALLVAAQQGNRGALDALVVELTPLLWHVARAQGVDRDGAMDVVQVVWLELLGSLERIRSPQALTSWLLTVARRESWRAKRAGMVERPSADVHDAEVRDPEPGPEERVVADEGRGVLWRALDELPERCRRLLRIVAFVPRPDYDAVGAALGMPRGSIGPTRGRCLAKLRVLLGVRQEGGRP